MAGDAVPFFGAVAVVGLFLQLDVSAELDVLETNPLLLAAVVVVGFFDPPIEEAPPLLGGVFAVASIGFSCALFLARPFTELELDVDARNAAILAAAARVIPTPPSTRAFLVAWLPFTFDPMEACCAAARFAAPPARLALSLEGCFL